jgi:DNA replication protein DnaC
MSIKELVQDKLKMLKLYGALETLNKQLEEPESEEQSYLTRLNAFLDNQILFVDNKRRARLHKAANLRWEHANISDIDYSIQTSLKKPVMLNLIELEWIANSRHLIFTGKTGAGKTHLACAFANEAIKQQISVGFYRFNNLILLLAAAQKDDALEGVRKKLNRIQLLVIDDWGVSPLNPVERHLLFDLIEARDKKSSLIITSQYSIEEWYDAFGDAVIADSVLDRIVHSGHHIHLDDKCGSMREILGINGSGESHVKS